MSGWTPDLGDRMYGDVDRMRAANDAYTQRVQQLLQSYIHDHEAASPFMVDMVKQLTEPVQARDERTTHQLAPGAAEDFGVLKPLLPNGGAFSPSSGTRMPAQASPPPALGNGPSVEVTAGEPVINSRSSFAPSGPQYDEQGRRVLTISGPRYVDDAPIEYPPMQERATRKGPVDRSMNLSNQRTNQLAQVAAARKLLGNPPTSQKDLQQFEKLAPYLAQRRVAEEQARGSYNRENIQGQYRQFEQQLKAATRLAGMSSDYAIAMAKLEAQREAIRRKAQLGSDDLKWLQKGMQTSQQAFRTAQDAAAAQEQLGMAAYPPGSPERAEYDRALGQVRDAQGSFISWSNLYAQKVGQRMGAQTPQIPQ